MVINNIRHTGIVVDDLEASLGFYKGLLGFEIEKVTDEDEGFICEILGSASAGLKTVKLSIGKGDSKQLIELLSFNEKKYGVFDLVTVGPTHLAVGVRDINKFYNKLHENGVHFISAPKTSPNKFAKGCFCKAPEGSYIELVQLLK